MLQSSCCLLVARNANLDKNEQELAIKSLGLLMLKKLIYAADVANEHLSTGNKMVDKLRELANKEGAWLAIVSVLVKSEWIDLTNEE